MVPGFRRERSVGPQRSRRVMCALLLLLPWAMVLDWDVIREVLFGGAQAGFCTLGGAVGRCVSTGSLVPSRFAEGLGRKPVL